MSILQKEDRICGWDSDRLTQHANFLEEIRKCAVNYTGSDRLSVKEITPPTEITEELTQLSERILNTYLKCFENSPELHIIIRKALKELEIGENVQLEVLEEAKIKQLIDALSSELESIKPQNEMFFRLILEESLRNHLSHGNRYDPCKIITVRYGMNSEGDFEVISSDQGEGFNPDILPDPTAEDRINEEGGRGVYIIREIADKVEYQDNGRTLRIVINLANKIKDSLSKVLKN